MGVSFEPPPRFRRRFLGAEDRLTRIGRGEIGGKARGLARLQQIIAERLDASRHPWAEVDIPAMCVLTTSAFDAFLERNALRETALSGQTDERITHAFLQASLPVEIVGDLKALVDELRQPLAVRSSSLLEDALDRPLAGVYETKMIPNHQPERDTRFGRLVDAVKFVFASTFLESARAYRRAAGLQEQEERMAVVLQEVVGARHGNRFYPHVSGVARSFNFFPVGRVRPEDGIVHLALGLGKTIVDGGVTWSYSPASPRIGPPFASAADLLRGTQTRFWAVNMGKPPTYSPMTETEFLVEEDLHEAELDGTLDLVASTYDPASDRLTPGTGRNGPRAITFAPLLLLQEYPVADLLRDVLRSCEDALGGPVELEFAMVLPRSRTDRVRLGLLQVRPMVGPEEAIEITPAELVAPDVLLASHKAMGNGARDEIRDIVYVKPDTFKTHHTRAIAGEIERLNRELADAARPYLLIGFGRWGSADPWLGIPVVWSQIAGAAVIVEATLPSLNVEPSQGSHFFHNLAAFRVPYLHVHHEAAPSIDWERLGRMSPCTDLEYVRLVHLDRPLLVKVDGRRGIGVIRLEGT
ncbi:MAG: PEP/pyruvate-binding domain-containing protein [Acidobacteriota bacterium]|jgi:hypothetical protein